MKTKPIIIGLMAVIFSSCTAPKYVPSSDRIDINQYGSYIKINRKTGLNIQGELLSVDKNKLIVLIENNKLIVSAESDIDYYYSKKVIIVPINEINRFTLRYAQPKYSGWSIPIGILLPLIPFPDPATRGKEKMPFHGFLALFSIPINLIVTANKDAFKYSDKEMTYDKMKMFARFPQGIPPNIDMARIK